MNIKIWNRLYRTTPRLLVYEPDPIFEHKPYENWNRFKKLPYEFVKLKNEFINNFKSIGFKQYYHEHGATELLFDFKSPDTLNDWQTRCDSTFDNGKSECNLKITANKTGLFYGYTCTTTPEDGKTKVTGFTTMKSKLKLRSFDRIVYIHFTHASHIVLRLRGDGRSYIFLAACPLIGDITRYNQHQYIIHTRGGPYWETIKIPVSKLILTSKGRIVDKQLLLNQFYCQSLGITLFDRKDGPFNLEIDYIALFTDTSHYEHFAYETYQVPPGANFG